MTIEEAIEVLEQISEDTVQRCCSTCGRPHIGTYNGICAFCSLCECVPDYAKEYHKKHQTVSRWKWNGRWSNEALGMAISALRQQEHFREATKKTKPLTMEELSKRNDPVFVPINDFPNGGYWCLCQNGYIIPPNGYGFMAKERPNWVFYSQKQEEDYHA